MRETQRERSIMVDHENLKPCFEIAARCPQPQLIVEDGRVCGMLREQEGDKRRHRRIRWNKLRQMSDVISPLTSRNRGSWRRFASAPLRDGLCDRPEIYAAMHPSPKGLIALRLP